MFLKDACMYAQAPDVINISFHNKIIPYTILITVEEIIYTPPPRKKRDLFITCIHVYIDAMAYVVCH